MGRLYNLSAKLRQRLVSAIGDPAEAGKLSEGVLMYKDVQLTTAQILALSTTEVEVIPAPGAGKCILVEGVYATLDYNSATYAAGSNTLDIRYTDSSGDLLAQLTNAFIELTADGRVQADMSAETIPVANAAVVAHIPTADPTVGDSDIYLRIYYRVVPALLNS